MFNYLRIIFISALLFLLCFGSTSQSVKALVTPTTENPNALYNDAGSLKELTSCDLRAKKKAVKIWDLGKVNEFLPIIPADCATYSYDFNGNKVTLIKPLTFAIIPDLIIRILGLLFSLAFWLVPLWIVLYGFFIIALPFDQGINTQSTVSVATIGKKAAEKAIELVAGIVLISISFTIVMTVLRLIGLDNGSINTDLGSFFT
jgi:hypothetical protein